MYGAKILARLYGWFHAACHSLHKTFAGVRDRFALITNSSHYKPFRLSLQTLSAACPICSIYFSQPFAHYSIVTPPSSPKKALLYFTYLLRRMPIRRMTAVDCERTNQFRVCPLVWNESVWQGDLSSRGFDCVSVMVSGMEEGWLC